MDASAQTPGQIFRSAEPAGAAILDPNGDGWITSSGATYSDTAVLVDESAEFEQSWTVLWHYENEPSSDLQTGSDCGPTELVDNYKTGQHAAYYRIIDPDNVDGNGDEMLAFRIRVNKDPNNAAYGYSFLLDTDGKFGASGPNQDLDYLSGNPGFEYEVLFASGNSGGVEVNDVNGVAAGNSVTTLVSYGDGVRDQRSYAIFTNCEDPSNTSENPIFIDFYINFSSLGGGITSQSSLRMVFASASSANTALGGSASDIGGVNDSNYPDDDSIFEFYIDNVPQFSFSSGYAAADTPPTITSGVTGTDLAENSGAGQTIYTITATDDVAVTSYAIGGTDAGLLSVNAASGVVTLVADPNYETKSSYSFNVTASDAATNTSAATTVTFSITNVDEVIPTITSGATGTNLAENSGATQTIYTITADANDGGTIQSYAIGGTDASLLTVNSSTGVVTLTANPNYETKSSYSFTVTATDETGTSAATTVTFSITDVDEVIPTITSGATGTNLAENSGATQTIYTITADANDGGTIQSYAIGGTDVSFLSVNSSTGVVTLTANPNYETKSSYSFTVTATDETGTSASTTVTFSITNVDEVIPTITSGATGTNLADNSGSGQTIYTITAAANDGGTIQSYAIGGTDLGLLTLTGNAVSLDADPDYDTKSSYSFTVTASDAAGTSAVTTVTFSITNGDGVAPVITSGVTGTDLAENSGAGQTIYTITATDNVAVTSYAIAGTDFDAGLLSVNAASGVVTLVADPNYETKSSYSFNVTASDAATNTSAATTVTFSITNVDEVIPTITSGATGTNLAENSGATQTIYTITADANDGGTIQSYAIGGTDASLLTVNSSTGVVTLTANPNYETKSSYSFTVTATDETGTSASTTVTFSITNVDEVIPTITSGATGTNLAENSGATQTIYTITADANDGGTIQSYAIGGTDVSFLTVNSSTGVVTLTADPNYETKSSYSFTVTATDETGTSAATTVTFSITDVVCEDPTACNYGDVSNLACTFATAWYADADGDNLGDASDSQSACTAPSGYVADNTDNCDNTAALNFDAGTYGNVACKLFAVTPTMSACDAAANATLDLSTLHSETGTWTYALDVNISGFASASVLGNILTIDYSGANTGSGTVELTATDGTNTGDIDVTVTESLYPYVTSFIVDGAATHGSLDGGWQIGFTGAYGAPVTVHYYHAAVFGYSGSSFLGTLGYGTEQTGSTDASGDLLTLPQATYWISGYTNIRGCFNPEPATGPVPTVSPSLRHAPVPTKL